MLDATLHEGLANVLAPLLQEYEAAELANRWYARDRKAMAEVKGLLDKGGAYDGRRDGADVRKENPRATSKSSGPSATPKGAGTRPSARLNVIEIPVARRKQGEADVVEGEYSEVPREEEVVS